MLATGDVLADPPATVEPVIDGTIGADWVDSGTLYPNGTLLVNDPTTDSLWSNADDIHNIYINWTTSTLYLGVDYTVNDNGMVLYLDFGSTDGITDFVGTGGYAGDWPRLISFPETNGIDYFYGAWNGGNGNVYAASTSTSTLDITTLCLVATGAQGGGGYHSELACPWSVLGVADPYPTSDINIIAAIVGGDDYGGPDTAPDANIQNGDPYNITVDAVQFMNLGIGPNAITVNSVAGQNPLALLATGMLFALGAVAVWRKRS